MLNRHDVAPLKQHMWTGETVGRFPDRTTHVPGELGAYLEGEFAALSGWIVASSGLARMSIAVRSLISWPRERTRCSSRSSCSRPSSRAPRP